MNAVQWASVKLSSAVLDRMNMVACQSLCYVRNSSSGSCCDINDLDREQTTAAGHYCRHMSSLVVAMPGDWCGLVRDIVSLLCISAWCMLCDRSIRRPTLRYDFITTGSRSRRVAGLAVVQSCMLLCNIISAGAGRPVQLFSPNHSHGHATAGMNAPPLPCCLSATVSKSE